MIEIKKGREPGELIAYRKSKCASYEDMSSSVKKVVLDALMQEQGHLCAYCMRKIPQTDGAPPASIEHWAAQSNHSEKKRLDYRNVFAVCSGNRGCGCSQNMTCDASKGNQVLTVNPTTPSTLIGIKYHSDGRIYSTNKAVNYDLNNVLNLNCKSIQLPNSRLKALLSLQKHIKKKCPTGNIQLYCKRIRDEILLERNQKLPFVGILLWWLGKKIE